MTVKKPKILIYDIETPLNQAYLFGCGEQTVRHTQLIPGYSSWGILCITYCWNDGSPVKCIRWTPKGGVKAIIEEFDKLIKKADQTIGKNSDRFDTKMINAQRMLAGLPGLPDWTKYTDDLEKQMRRYFRLPSQSLDYISNQLGLGGKIKMEFQDWVDISMWMEYRELMELSDSTKSAMLMLKQVMLHRYKLTPYEICGRGEKAFDKMCTYGMKDTEDTRTLWNTLSQHFDTKFNMATFYGHKIACKFCGSKNMKKAGLVYAAKTTYQRFLCNNCHKYGGRCPLSQVLKKKGRIS